MGLLKHVLLLTLDQHFSRTLSGRGEGAEKKRTFCTLVIMPINMDDPLPRLHAKRIIGVRSEPLSCHVN